MNRIKKKFGIFGFFFPMAILAIGGVITVAAFKAVGFDVFAWLASPHAMIAYLMAAILVLAWARLWFGGDSK